MAVGEAIEEAGFGGHVESIVRQIVAQLVYAIVGEVQRSVGIPVEAHSVPDACIMHNSCHALKLAQSRSWNISSFLMTVLLSPQKDMCCITHSSQVSALFLGAHRNPVQNSRNPVQYRRSRLFGIECMHNWSNSSPALTEYATAAQCARKY